MNLIVKNSLGEQFNITVIRYFSLNGNNYLIFTKNEVDETGYQKLYVTKVANMVGNNIVDEIEWNLVRDTIKVIAKAGKDNSVSPVQDLNAQEINGIMINGQKPFKLTVSSVSLLCANTGSPINTNVNIPQNQVNNVMNPMPSTPITPVSTPEVIANNIMPDFNTQQVTANPIDSVFPEMPTTNVINQTPVVANTPVMPSINEQPLQSVNNPEQTNVSINDPFNFSVPLEPVTPAVTTPIAPTTPVEPAIDYKKLYEEQTLKVNTLTAELEKYKSLVEQLKTILN